MVVLSFGCSGLQVDSEFRVFHHPNGRVAAEGHVTSRESVAYLTAEIEHRTRFPWQQYLRVGKWRYFYDNGDVRAELTYGLASYTECCAGGLCEQPYEVILGEVRIFAPDGRVTYDGPARNERRVLHTNCEGGDDVYVSALPLPADILPSFAQGFEK